MTQDKRFGEIEYNITSDSNREFFNSHIIDLSNLKSKKTVKTAKTVCGRYLEFLGTKDILNTSTGDIQKFFSQNKIAKLSLATIRTYATYIASLYSHLIILEAYEKNNPAQKWLKIKNINQRKNGKNKSLTLEEVRFILKKVLNPRDKCIITVLAKTGLRVGELVLLTLDDINFDDDILLIHNRKGSLRNHADSDNEDDKYTEFPIDNELKNALKSYLALRPEADSNMLFLTYMRAPMNTQTVQLFLRKLGKELDMHLHPHLFRYFFTSILVQNGCLGAVIQELRGDADSNMLQYYTTISPKQIKTEYLRAMPRLL